MPATAKDQKDSHLTGYAEVVALEQKEEERVQAALAKISAEDERTKKEWEEKALAAEAKARAEANEALKDYKEKELARIVTETEEQAVVERKAVESASKKNTPGVVQSLMDRVLDPSFLSA